MQFSKPGRSNKQVKLGGTDINNNLSDQDTDYSIDDGSASDDNDNTDGPGNNKNQN